MPVNIAGQFQPDQIRVLKRTEDRQSASKAVLDDIVHGLGRANTVFDEADSLAPHRVLQAVT